jgi:hypothetical protein
MLVFTPLLHDLYALPKPSKRNWELEKLFTLYSQHLSRDIKERTKKLRQNSLSLG